MFPVPVIVTMWRLESKSVTPAPTDEWQPTSIAQLVNFGIHEHWTAAPLKETLRRFAPSTPSDTPIIQPFDVDVEPLACH